MSPSMSPMKSKRMEQGWTQQQLADRVKVTRQTIALIEARKFNPSLKLCLEIAHALHTDLNTLFWEEADE
ncbi:helix-turn-helix transcriptional regulator [Exiguobacterium undae]|uniref:Transcriptional regulator n=2 Tax=Bacillales Family XII. Incertae Sedis TaxID=539742 RepID=A0A653IH70_9BACL|nr:helix-turn-helix transcriptional regulator [Exiguobacterium sp. N4-1P]VWX38629.1 Transcriptional regulator [Exiguobacterium oxidotolerans]